MPDVLSRTERMPEGAELELMLAQASDRIKARAGAQQRTRRNRRAVLWSGVGLVVAAATAVAATPLRTILIPDNGGQRAYLAVSCYDKGEASQMWFEDENRTTDAARVDPVAVCDAMYRNDTVQTGLDQIAARQRAVGRECVTVTSTDGGSWTITGLQSGDKSYSITGGPMPGRLPGQATPSPSAIPAAGCTALPTVTWDLSVPPMTACTSDDLTISVYQRSDEQTPQALCAAKGMTAAGK